MKSLKDSVVVVTGATSGIGRAAAYEFARAGAKVALAARRAEVLDEVARECLELGAAATLPIPTDITNFSEVRHLADSVAQEFGQIDVWLNDPGVGAMGAFDEIPAQSHDNVIAINLLGYMHGAHAVLPYFKNRKSGVIINMNSLGAWCPVPYAASYAASKFGLRAFSDSLRGELRRWPDIHICDLFPGCVDSPGLRNAANYTGKFMKPTPPLVSPERVARKIRKLAENPKPRTMLGIQSWGARLAYFFAPQTLMSLMAMGTETYLNHAQSAPVRDGNLSQPSQWSSVRGEWRKPFPQQILRALPAILGALGALLLLRSSKRQNTSGGLHAARS